MYFQRKLKSYALGLKIISKYEEEFWEDLRWLTDYPLFVSHEIFGSLLCHKDY